MSEENKKEQESGLELENKNTEKEATAKEENLTPEVEPIVKTEEIVSSDDAETAKEEVNDESVEVDSVSISDPEPVDAASEDENAKPVAEETPAETIDEAEVSKTEVSETEETPETEEKVETPPTTETTEVEQEVAAKEESDEQDKSSEAEEKVETPSTTEEPAEVESEVATKEQDESSETAEEVVEEVIDYTTYSREELVAAVEEIVKDDKFKGVDEVLNQITPLFFKIEKGIKESALNKFLLDGEKSDDFEFNHDELYSRFDGSVKLIRDKRARYYKEREANKERNYEKKLELLVKLRLLVNGDEGTTSLAPIKEIQQEWRATGAVPNQHNRTLWANYNALLDRFYDHRHILFELKELDRKKNQVLKEELCEKAEKLDKVEDLKTAIAQLNELHEEYKHVGPVPREVQEPLWQRFKTASDEVYKKRKVYLDDLKGELQENLVKKKALVEEIKEFTSFDSDRINDWNGKTKEVIAVQKKWEALGGLPREHAKEINKDFWSAFKSFFHNKNDFFKKLEGKRKESLEAKRQLVEDAKALKDSDDWVKTADKLKGLQRRWKELGPVPEKFRNSIYTEFKAACDEFFDNRRASQNKEEEGYSENLIKKEELCAQIFSTAENKEGEADDVDGFVADWKEIGFVPKNSIKKIDQKFQKALEVFVDSLDLSEDDRESLILKAQLSGLTKGPNADRNIQKKEGSVRRQVKELEDNISLWNNNLAFFANSKTADKLKKEFDEKILKSEEELQKLKKQLRIIRSI